MNLINFQENGIIFYIMDIIKCVKIREILFRNDGLRCLCIRIGVENRIQGWPLSVSDPQLGSLTPKRNFRGNTLASTRWYGVHRLGEFERWQGRNFFFVSATGSVCLWPSARI